MSTLAKIVLQWNGLPGGAGYSIFWSTQTVPNLTPFNSFLVAIQALYPQSVTIVSSNTGELIESTTGKMTGTYTTTGATSTIGTGATSYTPQSGALVKWNTGFFANGRAVRGRTYIVPLTIGQFGAGGVLQAAAVTTLQTAATNLVAQSQPNLVVYSRPRYKKADTPGDPPVLVRQGAFNQVVSASVTNKVCTLNGRRDV